MKLSPREAEGYFARPDPEKAGLLIYGADAMRVALKRQQVLAALLGPAAEEEMRLTRIPGADLRGEPAQLLDALKAVGFFPGQRAVFVEGANDAALAAITAALDDWQPGDATLIVTAGGLKAASKLRKLFEGRQNVLAAALYDDPPSRAEVDRILRAAGLTDISPDALNALGELAGALGPGDFTRMVEKLALYKLGDDTPLSPEDVDACAPLSTEAGLDDVLNVVAESRSAEIGPLIRRLQAQGTNAVALCIGATRHFRTLYAVAAHPDGVSTGMARLRPPVFGKRRDRMQRQAQNWSAHKLEKALTVLTDTDLQMRSAGRTAPDMALMERALIRIAMLGARR